MEPKIAELKFNLNMENAAGVENGNLKIEGCLLRMCGHEEWKPITVKFNDDGTKKVELKENL